MVLCVSAVLLAASNGMAARCGSVVGADPPNYFVFCDDFDRYCDPVPPNSQDACDCSTTYPDQLGLESVWTPLPKLGSGASAPHTLFSYWLAGENNKFVSSKCHSDATQGYGLYVYQADSTGCRIRRNERDMTAEILAHPMNTTGYGYVNGTGEIDRPLTDANTVPAGYIDSMSPSARPEALKGFFRMNLLGSPYTHQNMVNYVELFADNDRAPFNWVMQYCTGDSINNPKLVREGDGQVHASFALGLVSWYDSNPCDVDTGGRRPAQARLVVFDGLAWRQLMHMDFDIPLTGPIDADDADLFPADGWNDFSFAIGADYIEVRVRNARSTSLYAEGRIPNPYLVARVPRQYKGGFNKMAIGPNHGLDVTTPTCEYFLLDGQSQQRCNGGENNLVGACTPATVEEDCPIGTTMTSPLIMAGANIMVDEVSLFDGSFVGMPRACCLPDKTCQVLAPAECEALGGVYMADYLTCDDTPCCPIPFADYDIDDDVDMDDFAMLQRCLNIGDLVSGSLGVDCGCFDQNENGVIDADDVEEFIKCGTGAGVAWEATAECPG